MKIYFDRTLPLYLSDKPTFDGIEVDVDEDALYTVEALRLLIQLTEKAIEEAAAPERSNQDIANKFVGGLKEITDGSK
jgi:hypothetical protein